MKRLVYLFVLCLAGCGTLQHHKFFNRSLLDTAPQDAQDVRYPEWGQADQSTRSVPAATQKRTMYHASTGNSGTGNGSALTSLSTFLMNNGIDYEIIPGNFDIVHVKRPVLFEFNSERVKPETRNWLIPISQYLAVHSGLEVVVDGHTDDVGGTGYNNALAKKRADAVKHYLVGTSALARSAVSTRSFGSQLPTCDTGSSAANDACNRRVEIYFIVAS